MSFLLSNFVELGNDELRKVNGGAGSCGGGSGEGAGSSSGSGGSSGGAGSGAGGSGNGGYSGGGTSTAPSMTVSAGAGSCGGGSSGGSGGSGGGSSYSGGSSGSGNPGSGTSGNPGTGGTPSGNDGSGYSGGRGNCSGGYTPGYSSTPPATDTGNKKDTDGAGSDPTVTLASIGCSTNIQDGKRGWLNNKFEYSNNSTMQEYKGLPIDYTMNGDNQFSQSGCYMEAVKKALSEASGKKVTLEWVNEHVDENKDGLLSGEEVKKGFEKVLPENATVTQRRIENPTKKDLEEIASDTNSAIFTFVQGENVNDKSHWIQGTGFSSDENGTAYIQYSPTSNNDIALKRQYVAGPVPEGSSNTHHVKAIEVISIQFN